MGVYMCVFKTVIEDSRNKLDKCSNFIFLKYDS